MTSKKVAIIGAGISGLTLAYFLNKNQPNLSIEIFEKESKPGGKIESISTDIGNFSFGPKTILMKKGSALESLIQNLGLTEELLTPNKSAKKRYIVYQDKLVALPQNIFSFLKAPFVYMILPFFKELFVKKYAYEETVEEFFIRRFGENITNYLIDPLVKGIYGGGVKELSCNVAFPLFKELENSYGSLLKGMLLRKKEKRNIISFSNGLSTLVDRLKKNINAKLIFENEITNLSTLNHDHIFLALDYSGLKKLVPDIFSTFNFFAKSITQVVLGYKKKATFEGFGCLVPSIEKSKVLGILFDSCIFPNNDKDIFFYTVMIDGAEEKDDFYLELAKQHVKKYLELDENPITQKVKKYQDGIIHPKKGHRKHYELFLNQFYKLYPKCTLLGSGLNGVSVADQIENAYNFSKKDL